MTLSKANKYKVIVTLGTGPKSSVIKSLVVEGLTPPAIGDSVLDDGRMWKVVSIIEVTGPDFAETR